MMKVLMLKKLIILIWKIIVKLDLVNEENNNDKFIKVIMKMKMKRKLKMKKL